MLPTLRLTFTIHRQIGENTNDWKET
jgi:hypothetical protein